jgi:hypothetical protein
MFNLKSLFGTTANIRMYGRKTVYGSYIIGIFSLSLIGTPNGKC